MTTQLTGTVVDGALKLDQPLDLSNAARVKVVVEIDADLESHDRFREGVERIEKLKRAQPINSGGLLFTRDQLHDRD